MGVNRILAYIFHEALASEFFVVLMPYFMALKL